MSTWVKHASKQCHYDRIENMILSEIFTKSLQPDETQQENHSNLLIPNRWITWTCWYPTGESLRPPDQAMNDTWAVSWPKRASAFAWHQTENNFGSGRSCHPLDNKVAIFTCCQSVPLTGVKNIWWFDETPLLSVSCVVSFRRVKMEQGRELLLRK